MSSIKLEGFHAIFLFLTIILGLIIYISDPIPIQTLRNTTFDQFQRWKPRTYNGDIPVKIIDIDEESLQRLGQWPWPRTRIAELVALLQNAGASAIAIDFQFADFDRTSPRSLVNLLRIPARSRQLLNSLPDHDLFLASAIAKSQVVLGFTLKSEGSQGSAPEIKAPYVASEESPEPNFAHFESALTSLRMLESVAKGNGALNFISDADGNVRKLPLLFSFRKAIVPSLVAETLRIAQRADKYTMRSESEHGYGLSEIGIGKLAIPTTPKGEIWLSFSESAPSRYISAWKIFEAKEPKTSLANQIVLIGSSADGVTDRYFSPVAGMIPAVELHAQAIEQILSGDRLNRPSWCKVMEVIAIIGGGLIVGITAFNFSAAVSFFVFLGVLAALWISAWFAYASGQLLIDPTIPSLMLALTFIFNNVLQHLYSERRQRWVEQAFSRYISPNLVDHLIAHPDALELGGRRQICSFVFTDLVDFTGLLEKMDPGEAVTLLNVYLDRMIAIAFSHQGTLDRIVGDAVAIMFSAPVLQTDHQRRAVECAMDMHRFANQYCSELKAKGIIFGQTRIGIHTGEVIVGNFGGKTIFDYRALGDPVNTASRLEGANKYLGTLICVSEHTLSGCPDIPARPIGRLLLKGKSVSLMVFEVLDSKATRDTEIKDYITAYELMRDMQTSALEAFRQLATNRPTDGLVAFHLKRLRSGKSGDLIEFSEK
ncbi:MAG: CHASE2 domain-containing protein [Gammaproteobacteria bacterium]